MFKSQYFYILIFSLLVTNQLFSIASQQTPSTDRKHTAAQLIGAIVATVESYKFGNALYSLYQIGKSISQVEKQQAEYTDDCCPDEGINNASWHKGPAKKHQFLLHKQQHKEQLIYALPTIVLSAALFYWGHGRASTQNVKPHNA